MKPLVVILMGSKSDLNHAEKIAEAARHLVWMWKCGLVQPTRLPGMC